MMNDPHLRFLLKALTQNVRIHTNKKQLSQQRLYKLMKQHNIKTIKIIDGPNDELWLLQKEPKA